MSQLTLMDVVGGYQQGVQWKQGQEDRSRNLALQEEEQARAKKQRADLEAADAAFGERIKAGEQSALAQQQQAWQAAGKPPEQFQPQPWQPDDSTMFEAAQARNNALAKAGRWKEWMQSRAELVPIQQRVRQEALQQLQMDGDIRAFALRTYPTILNGRKITNVEVLEGGPKDSPKGAPSGPTKVRITTDDGRVSDPLDPAKMVETIKRSLVPNAAELEVKSEFAHALAAFKAANDAALAGVRGSEDRKTEGMRQEGRLGLAEYTEGKADARNAATNETRVKVANIQQAGQTARAGSGAGGARYFAGDDGFMYADPRDGNGPARIVMGADGKPVKTEQWGKRVDAEVKRLSESREGRRMTPEQLRVQAEKNLAGQDRSRTGEPSSPGVRALNDFISGKSGGTAPAFPEIDKKLGLQ